MKRKSAPFIGFKAIVKIGKRTTRKESRKTPAHNFSLPSWLQPSAPTHGWERWTKTYTALAQNKSQAAKIIKEKVAKEYPRSKGYIWHIQEWISPR